MGWFLVLIFFTMCFCHIADDYYLQGILASMKQKNWWTKQESYEDKYKYDYIVALIMHAFSWSFMILIPFFLLGLPPIFLVITLILNGTIHAFIDDLKVAFSRLFDFLIKLLYNKENEKEVIKK